MDSKDNDDNCNSGDYLPSIRQQEADIKAMEKLLETIFNNSPKSIELKNQVQVCKEQLEEINFYKVFDDIFLARGWISYNSMNLDLILDSVKLARNNRIDEAESNLVNSIDEKAIDFGLMRMIAVKAYLPRKELLSFAKNDYLEGRYYSSILVLLTAVDGIVNDIQQTGFFACNTSITAWDSLAAHGDKFQKLKDMMATTRKNTNTTEITVPYRNGILHGRDLNYNNKLVAAKLWAVLFALRDWAVRAERGDTEARDDFTVEEPTQAETIRKCINASLSHKKVMSDLQQTIAWESSITPIGDECPAVGRSNEYSSGSPEQALVKWIEYWQSGNFGKMVDIYSFGYDERKESTAYLAGQLRELYGEYKPSSFCLLCVNNKAAAVTEIDVEILFEKGEISRGKYRIFIWYESIEGTVQARFKPEGAWRVCSFDPGISS